MDMHICQLPDLATFSYQDQLNVQRLHEICCARLVHVSEDHALHMQHVAEAIEDTRIACSTSDGQHLLLSSLLRLYTVLHADPNAPSTSWRSGYRMIEQCSLQTFP